MRRILLTLFSILSGGGFPWAQGAGVSALNLGRHQDIGARPMAMGGSFTGIANDFTALYHNPAGLTQIKKHEAQFTVEWANLQGRGKVGNFPARETDQDLVAVQSFGVVLPVPTSVGGLSFALGSYSPRTFSDVLTFQDALTPQRGLYSYRAEGDLVNYRAGMAVDLSPDAILGFGISYISGEEQIDIGDVPASRYLRSYSGFSLEPALLFKIMPRLKLGASLVALERYSVNETFQESGQSSLQQEYNVRYPIQFKLGLSYQGIGFLLAADYKALNWGQYRIGVHDADFLENPGLKNEHLASFGGETLLLPLPILLRAGYAYNTVADSDIDPEYNIHRASGGLGFILGGTVEISAAYSFAFWEGQSGDAYSEDREHRGLLTFGYRY